LAIDRHTYNTNNNKQQLGNYKIQLKQKETSKFFEIARLLQRTEAKHNNRKHKETKQTNNH